MTIVVIIFFASFRWASFPEAPGIERVGKLIFAQRNSTALSKPLGGSIRTVIAQNLGSLRLPPGMPTWPTQAELHVLPDHRAPIILLTAAFVMPLTFSVWQALLNNFVVERAAFTGAEIGLLKSLREVQVFSRLPPGSCCWLFASNALRLDS
jgi:hypothetical protein